MLCVPATDPRMVQGAAWADRAAAEEQVEKSRKSWAEGEAEAEGH